MMIARQGDTIVIWKLDRLARSLQHLIDLARAMQQRGIALQSLTDHIDTSTASGRLLFNMLSSIAEFERDIITERVGAGLARARAAGRVGGRPKVGQSKIDVAMANIARGESISEAARVAKISRATLNRAISVSKTSASRLEAAGGSEAN